MFTMLPTFDILQENIATYKDEENRKHSYNIYKKKLLKDMDIDSPSSEGKSTDWGIESTDEEPRNSQNEDNIEDDNPEVKDDESSKTENGIGAENKETTI